MDLSDTELESLLNRHFGLHEFGPGQKEVISSVLSGRNTLAVTSPVYDNSLCYKLPALVLDGLTVVVSRSRQAVETELADLLYATHINNSLPIEHLQKRIWNMAQGKYKTIFVGPEQFRNRDFLIAVSRIPVSLLVVEDAHCISHWGHDFRPDYLDIVKAFREMDAPPPIMALAGACTQRARNDILLQLRIEDAEIFLLDSIRSDLSLEVISTPDPEKKCNILRSLVRELDGQGIIYANSRNKTVEICEILKDQEPDVAFYHSGLDQDKRTTVERAFSADQLRVVVATRSFGTGLDKPGIRFIINLDMPDRPESYYHQVSMAGGDGKPARCILMYSPSDRDFQRKIIETSTMPSSDIWRMSEVLAKHASDGGEQLILSRSDKESGLKLPFKKAMDEWLRDHFSQLPVGSQRELSKLRDSYKSLDDRDRNPYSQAEYDQYLESENWREFSKSMLAEHEQCQICGMKSEHVHHLYYRTLRKERPKDVMVLCSKCHCFIHPDNPMTRKIFREAQESAKNQPELFDEPDMESYPLVVLPYGQLELEAALDYYKLNAALREMEMLGMLSVLPDCSMHAKVHILVPRNLLITYADCDAERKVVKWLLEKSEPNPEEELYLDFASLKGEMPCHRDVLEDCLLALKYAKAISYKPFRRSMALRLVDLDVSTVEDMFERLRGDRYNALRAMESYIHTRECRQEFLREYMGYESDENCGECDNCRDERNKDFDLESVQMPRYAYIALELVNKSEGKLSKDTLVGILAGSKQRTTRFDKWEEFGALSMFGREHILRLMDLLIGHGFLKEEGGAYSQVELADGGGRALNGELEPYDKVSIAALTDDMHRIAGAGKEESGEISIQSETDRVFMRILLCAEKTDGQVGRRGLMNILRGEKSKRLAKYEFDHIEEYGSLSDMSGKAVLEYIDAMIERGCLSVGSFFFPMLRLTDVGQKRLNRMRKT